METAILDKVYIINPDPWPKVRHQNRRIINTQNLNLIKKKLKHKGQVIITTDSVSYFNSISDLVNDNNLQFQAFNFCELKKDDYLYGVSSYQKKAIIKKKPLYRAEFINN